MKKLLSLLLAILMALTLGACGNDSNTKQESSTNDSSVIEQNQPGETNVPQKGSKMEQLLKSYWKYRYLASIDGYADGFEVLLYSKTDANGVEVERAYTTIGGTTFTKRIVFDPAKNTLILFGPESTVGELIEFNDKGLSTVQHNGNDVSDKFLYEFEYDAEGYLTAKKLFRNYYTVEYSADKKTCKDIDEKGNVVRVFEFDDNGNRIKQTGMSVHGELTDEIYYDYDSEGRIVKVYTDDEVMRERTFDENDNMLTEKVR